MAKPTDYAIDAPLTSFVQKYKPGGGMVGAEGLTRVPVGKMNFSYHKFNKDEFWRIPDTLRAPGAEAHEIDIAKTKVPSEVEQHALRAPIEWETLDNADSVLQVESTKAAFVEDLLALRLEKKVFGIYTDAGVSGVTLSGTDRWFVSGVEQGTSDPEDDIKTGKENIRGASGGWYPNVMVVPAQVATLMAKHSKIRDIVKYTMPGLWNPAGGRDLPEQLFGMRVLIPGSVENTAKEGATYSSANIWGNDVWLAYISPMPSADAFTAGSIFWYQQVARKWDEEKREVRLVQSKHMYLTSIVDAKLIYRIQVAIA